MQRLDLQYSGWLAWLATLMLSACADDTAQQGAPSAAGSPMLVLYASLPEERLAGVARRYREETGIQVNYVADEASVLIDKLVRKAHRPGADVVLLTDASHLALALDEDVLRPIRSPSLATAVPEAERDPDGYWYGLGHRAEVIVYDSRQVEAEELGGYTDLAGAAWHGRLCLQRSSAGRSQSLVAALIASLGVREAELAVRGWRANLATNVFDTQDDLLAAVDTGECAIGIVSSHQAAQFAAAGRLTAGQLYFPTAAEGGAFRQPIAAGVSRHANDAEQATRFLEWLTSAEGQAALHAEGADFPLPGATLPEPLTEWAGYAASGVTAARAGYHRHDAEQLIERARYR